MKRGRRRVRWARRAMVFSPAAIVVILGAISFGALRRVLDIRDRVAHTRDVLETTSSLLIALLDAETGERGYLLTRDTTFLAPYQGAALRADTLLAELRTLTRDNPAQQVLLDTLVARSHERLAVLAAAVADARGGLSDAAVGVVAQGPGKRLMDSARR